MNQSDLSRLLGKQKSYISEIFNESREASEQFVRLFCEFFDQISPEWVLTGRGEMLQSESSAKEPQKGSVIRYWSELIATGGDQIVFNAEQRSGFQEMRLPNFTDCTDAIPLIGDSMYPRYKSGQIIVVKPWIESFIEYGQIYLIVTKSNYCTVKYLRPGADNSKITCCSENAACYPPFEILLDDIANLYIVKGAIEQNTY